MFTASINMIRVLLTRVKTRDNIFLDGIALLPRRRADTILVWIHGLGSNFAHGQILTKELSGQCAKNNIAYLKFNTRGHDIVNRDGTDKNALYGAGFEKFEECVFDIRAMIARARKLGCKRIVLAGHSTGANKALYYLYKTKDRSVKGLVLLGPVNDGAAGRKKFGPAGLARGVKLAEKLSRKNPHTLMPLSYGVFSAKRFLSMFRPGETEDIFPYLDPQAEWQALQNIRAPLAIVFGSRDEYLDPVRGNASNGVNRPAQRIIDIFRAHAPLAKSPAPHLSWTRHHTYDMLSGKGAGFTGIIIKNADHGFKGKEKALAKTIINWIAHMKKI